MPLRILSLFPFGSNFLIKWKKSKLIEDVLVCSHIALKSIFVNARHGKGRPSTLVKSFSFQRQHFRVKQKKHSKLLMFMECSARQALFRPFDIQLSANVFALTLKRIHQTNFPLSSYKLREKT